LFALLRDLARVDEPDAARLAGLAGALPPRREPPRSLALRWSLPDWIAATFERDFGEQADALAASLNAPGPIFLRANPLRTTPAELAARLRDEGVPTRPGRWSRLALVIEGPRHPNILALSSHREGWFE